MEEFSEHRGARPPRSGQREMQALVLVDSLSGTVPRQKAQEGEARKGGL